MCNGRAAAGISMHNPALSSDQNWFVEKGRFWRKAVIGVISYTG
jgi:hypothetical protein